MPSRLVVQEGNNSYLPMYDAMGNVHGMITAASATFGGTTYPAGSIVAEYEYDGFGKTVRESGPYAAANRIRYSTKYTDAESGLVYYGMRHYSPSLGRFINRDPLGEAGGLNLYGFCGNNGVNRWDYLGMDADSEAAEARARAEQARQNGERLNAKYKNSMAGTMGMLESMFNWFYNDDPYGMLNLMNNLGVYIGNRQAAVAKKAQEMAKTDAAKAEEYLKKNGYRIERFHGADGTSGMRVTDAEGNVAFDGYVDADTGIWVNQAPNSTLSPFNGSGSSSPGSPATGVNYNQSVLSQPWSMKAIYGILAETGDGWAFAGQLKQFRITAYNAIKVVGTDPSGNTVNATVKWPGFSFGGDKMYIQQGLTNLQAIETMYHETRHQIYGILATTAGEMRIRFNQQDFMHRIGLPSMMDSMGTTNSIPAATYNYGWKPDIPSGGNLSTAATGVAARQ